MEKKTDIVSFDAHRDSEGNRLNESVRPPAIDAGELADRQAGGQAKDQRSNRGQRLIVPWTRNLMSSESIVYVRSARPPLL